MKKFFLLVLLLIIGGLGYLYYTSRQAVNIGENFAKLTPAQRKERRAETRKLQEQIHDIRKAAGNREHKPFSLTITEAQLNTLLQDNLRSQNTPIRDLRAGISADALAVQGRVLYKDFDTTVTMSGPVKVVDNKLTYSVDSLKIGFLPAPAALREKLKKKCPSVLTNTWPMHRVRFRISRWKTRSSPSRG